MTKILAIANQKGAVRATRRGVPRSGLDGRASRRQPFGVLP